MIRNEYLRFLQTLISNDSSDNMRKIANLVLNHLDTLVLLSTAQGHRIKKVVELAQNNWATTSADIQPAQQQPTTQNFPFMQLKSLSVGPFRGFAKQEYFDLSSRLVLIYGPNGTGKSSFCEALEFGLLDNVAEAENKRFRPQNYLKNAYKNDFTQPTLMGLDSKGNDIQISANESLYRFCFVEKTRIDRFSRIAAQTPAKRSELISTLFGLDAFSEFVRNFTDTMDRYIDLEGVKAKDLAKKQIALAGYQQQLKTTIPEKIQDIETEKKDLAKTYREKCTFEEMVRELQGTEENTGLIKQLDDELQKQLPHKSNVTTAKFKTLKQSIETDLEHLQLTQNELSKASQQVSFKQLYEAVTKVRESSSEQCPACQTPLEKVKVNPFVHAESELKKLEELSRLQETVKTLLAGITRLLSKLSELINDCCSYNQKNNPLSTVKATSENVATIDWWKSLLQDSGDGSTFLCQLEKQVTQLENDDIKIDKAMNEREVKQAKLRRLREIDKKIDHLKTRQNTAKSEKKTAEDAIAKFDTENAKLIEEAKTEKAVVTQNQTITDAYNIFVQTLNLYKNELPAQLVADLGETVVELYNAFNRNDAEHEKLADIRLPLSEDQHLEISFKNKPSKYFDALHILSEGHIRCIGLAILTAKNLKENCPILIFDDPVNAIDDEHRESIRKTLFVDSFFENKQLVLACHGEEFFKDIQNLLSVEQASQLKNISFLPKNDFHICVDLNCAPRNYIISARTHYNKNEIRDALSKSRKALESLTKEKVWSYVDRYGDSNLSIKLQSSTAPIGLRNLTEQLKSKIEKDSFRDEYKQNILTPINSLLGIDGASRVWRYLNKGTHDEEDRDEFDRQTVNQIITELEKLDDALKERRP